MALWQYSFLLIPKAAIQNVSLDDIKDNDGFVNDDQFWAVLPTNPIVFESVGQILAAERSWSDDIIQFGDLGKSCCEISVENQMVVSVRFRIDYTSVYLPLLDFITEFCLLNDFVLLDESTALAPLNSVVLSSIIKSSPQFTLLNQFRTS